MWTTRYGKTLNTDASTVLVTPSYGQASTALLQPPAQTLQRNNRDVHLLCRRHSRIPLLVASSDRRLCALTKRRPGTGSSGVSSAQHRAEFRALPQLCGSGGELSTARSSAPRYHIPAPLGTSASPQCSTRRRAAPLGAPRSADNAPPASLRLPRRGCPLPWPRASGPPSLPGSGTGARSRIRRAPRQQRGAAGRPRPQTGTPRGGGALRAGLPEAVLRGGPGRGGPTGRSARSAARHCVRPTRLCVRRRGRHGPGAAGRAAERGRE